jgi:DNA-binding PadR family transcriptional regulator
MSEFIRIQNKIDSLQHSESRYQLSSIGKELLTELQRIKKEHFEMLEMLKKLVERLEENDLGRLNAVSQAKQLIKEATEL